MPLQVPASFFRQPAVEDTNSSKCRAHASNRDSFDSRMHSHKRGGDSDSGNFAGSSRTNQRRSVVHKFQQYGRAPQALGSPNSVPENPNTAFTTTIGPVATVAGSDTFVVAPVPTGPPIVFTTTPPAETSSVGQTVTPISVTTLSPSPAPTSTSSITSVNTTPVISTSSNTTSNITSNPPSTTTSSSTTGIGSPTHPSDTINLPSIQSTSSAAASSTDAPSKSKIDMKAVIGGGVGGIMQLIVVAVIIVIIVKRRRRRLVMHLLSMMDGADGR